MDFGCEPGRRPVRSQIPLRYPGRKQIRGWSQTCRRSASEVDDKPNSSSLHVKYKLFIKILSSSLNTMLIVDKHCSDVCCDEFSMPQIGLKSKWVPKRTVTSKILFAISMGKTGYFKHRKYQNLWMNNKVRGDQICNLFAFSSTSAENLNS